MEQHDLARRTLLKAGAAVGLAGLASVTVAGPAAAFGDPGGADEVLLWLDQPDPIPPGAVDIVAHLLKWEALDSWRTPNGEFFTVKHYNLPSLTAGSWRLDIDGLVNIRCRSAWPPSRPDPGARSTSRSNARAITAFPSPSARSATPTGPAPRWPTC